MSGVARGIANVGMMILVFCFILYAIGELAEMSEESHAQYKIDAAIELQLEKDRLEAVAQETGSDTKNVLYKHRTSDGLLYQTNDAYYLVIFEGKTAVIKTIVYDGKPGDKGESKTEISF